MEFLYYRHLDDENSNLPIAYFNKMKESVYYRKL